MGLFIAIEGGDGSGKGTHSDLLLQHMIDAGYEATKISFPRYATAKIQPTTLKSI